MSELPDKPERCPYTLNKCWLKTTKGEGICKGCKYEKLVSTKQATLQVKPASEHKDINSPCPVDGRSCDMVDSLGLRWCEGCTVKAVRTKTHKVLASDAITEKNKNIALPGQNEEKTHRTMESNVSKSVRSKVSASHKKVGLLKKIRNLFR